MERTITTLPLEDVYPNEKNYREVTDEGVAAIAASIGDAGQRTPIEVWQDGDIYWVVDGNHRLLAMKELGMTEIAAVVVPHPSDAEYVVNSVASNVAIPVTALDKSHGAQMMFATGVPPKSIAAQLGISEERATKAKRGYAIAKDYAEDMGLERLEALNDFEGDEEACQRIMTAPENDWRRIVNVITAEKASVQHRLDAMEIVKNAGCEFVADVDRSKMAYLEQAYVSRFEAAPEGAKWATYNQYAAMITWYGEIGEEDPETPEEAAKREEADRRKAAVVLANEKRRAFVFDHLTNNGPVTANNDLRDFAWAAWEDGVVADVSDIDASLAEITGCVPRFYAAILSSVDGGADGMMHPESMNGIGGYWLREYGPNTVAYFDALVAVGYEISEVEQARLAEIRAELAPKDETNALPVFCYQDWGCKNGKDGYCLKGGCNSRQSSVPGAQGGDE